MARLGKTEAIDRLRKALITARQLSIRPYSILSAPEFYKWQRNTKIAIGKTFGDADRAAEFDRIEYEPSVATGRIRDTPHMAYRQGMGEACGLLEAMIEEIEEYWDDEQSISPGAPNDEPRNNEQRIVSNRVFVVHGREEGAKQQAARTLEQLGLEPIVLHEQPNRGRTIIGKFEDAAESVGFAVVLMTGDDEGRLRGDTSGPKPRARQNAVFELGYLSAKLGRQRVCALIEDGVEAPSDYDGVVYIPLDGHGAWRFTLAKELRAAGYDADANKLM